MAQPVAAALNISPDPIRPGGEFIVAIGVRVAAGYHIQGASPDREPFLPTSIDLKLPDTCTALNEWEVPKPVLSSAGKAIYTDSVVFRRRCRVSSNAGAGIVSIQSTLRFQACSDEVCRPPAQLALATGFRISN